MPMNLGMQGKLGLLTVDKMNLRSRPALPASRAATRAPAWLLFRGRAGPKQVFETPRDTAVSAGFARPARLLTRIPRMNYQFDDVLGRFYYKNQCNTIITTGETRVT